MNLYFYNQIAISSAHTKCREEKLQMVLENESYLQDLFEIAFNILDKNHHKAVWIVELVAQKHFEKIIPFSAKIIENARLYKHQSAKRGISLTLLFMVNSIQITFSETQIEKIITTCLDWMIDDSKLVPKWCAMQILQKLSLKHLWLKIELRQIIEQDFAHQTPGYQSMARKILANLKVES